MSQKEAKELLDYLEGLQNEYTQRILVLNSTLSRLSRAILQNENLNEIVKDINSSVGLHPPQANSLEQENKQLKKTIKKLEQEKIEHKSNFHCLQRVRMFFFTYFLK